MIQPVQDTYAVSYFVSWSGKKFQTVKLGISLCVLHAGNVISSRYSHVTSFAGDSRQPRTWIPCIFIYARNYLRTYDEKRVRSRFVHVLSYTNPHIHIQCVFRRSLWLGAIPKLYPKRLAFNPPGKFDAVGARQHVGARITVVFSTSLSTRLIRKMRNRFDRVHEKVLGENLDFELRFDLVNVA